MLNMNRRSLLTLFGVAAMQPVLSAQAPTTRKVAVVRPGQNRFPYTTDQMGKMNACKVTSEDSAGGCSIFELIGLPRSGPPLHVHHREDEWYYVLAGNFVFEVGGVRYELPVGGSIFAPRDMPHRWANMDTTEGRVILVCQPGGFERFFDELGDRSRLTASTADQMHLLHELHAKYGMEMLGPPLLP
jgi:mannose-6-phosphate isomerase-like protein (cupin superfamily)